MNNWIFCIDSDGCVMDTMTYKHNLFFGPIAAEIFDVHHRENSYRIGIILIYIQRLVE